MTSASSNRSSASSATDDRYFRNNRSEATDLSLEVPRRTRLFRRHSLIPFAVDGRVITLRQALHPGPIDR